MDYSSNRAHWGGYSTMDLVPGSFAFGHLSSPSAGACPSPQMDERFMGSPARSVSSMGSSPSPPPSDYPQTPTSSYTWGSPSHHQHPSPIIRNHGSPLLGGSPLIQHSGYREYDLSSNNPAYSLASGYSSVLCPQYLTSPCLSTSRPEPVFRQGRRGPVVPQKHYSTHFSAGKTPKTIPFRLQGSSEAGVPMRLLCGEFAPEVPIEDAHGQVFGEDVPTTITIRIWWPGYDLYPRRVTMRKSTGLLNRIDLAMAITECFKSFVDEAQPITEGASAADARWRVGKGGYTVRDLVLLSLSQVSKGSFQADIRLELDR